MTSSLDTAQTESARGAVPPETLGAFALVKRLNSKPLPLLHALYAPCVGSNCQALAKRVKSVYDFDCLDRRRIHV